MNLDDLKVIRNDERRSRKLTPLKENFYTELKTYLSSLTDSKNAHITDEYKNALQVAEAIYDKRVAKIIKLAALAAKGHKENAPVTEEETKLFEIIYDAFTRYKEDMLAHASSDHTQSAVSAGYARGIQVETVPPLTDPSRIEGERDGQENQEDANTNQNTLPGKSNSTDSDIQQLGNARALIQENKNMRYVQVRVLANLPAFVGLDGENYKLDKGETALLPEGNARALTKRHVAIIIGDKVEDAQKDTVNMSGV